MKFRKKPANAEQILYRAWTVAAPAIARLIWIAGPADGRQRRAFAFARGFEALVECLLGGRAIESTSIQAFVMNSLISQFCCIRPGFSVDFELSGEDSLLPATRAGKGILLTTIHTKLGLIANAALLSGDRGPVLVGNPPRNLVASSWGSKTVADHINARDPFVISKIGKAIQDGRIVVAFVDFGRTDDGRGFISPNLFRWAAEENIPLGYLIAKMGQQGQITVEVAAQPPEAIDATEKALGFIKFLETRWRRRFVICRPKEVRAGAGK